jgi:hypothetical protein
MTNEQFFSFFILKDKLLFFSQPVFALIAKCYTLGREAGNINIYFIVFGST